MSRALESDKLIKEKKDVKKACQHMYHDMNPPHKNKKLIHRKQKDERRISKYISGK